MTNKETVQAGNDIIHAISTNVSDVSATETKQVVQNLVDTMREVDLVGMAAPQIGENVRVFVTEIRRTKYRQVEPDELRVFVNPTVVSVSEGTAEDYEGCGSVAEGGLFGLVKRPAEITVEGYNEAGEKFTCVANGLLARVIQHELDHLDGTLFIEKVTDFKKIMSRNEYLKMKSKNQK